MLHKLEQLPNRVPSCLASCVTDRFADNWVTLVKCRPDPPREELNLTDANEGGRDASCDRDGRLNDDPVVREALRAARRERVERRVARRTLRAKRAARRERVGRAVRCAG